MSHHAWLFEAKGIQRYIFDSGSLRNVVGASDLVDCLASSRGDDLIGTVIEALGLNDEVGFSRRAGGAFVLHGRLADLEAVRALFRLCAATRLPGLEMSDAFGKGETPVEAARDAYRNGTAVRFNSAAEVPPAVTPFTAVNPRSGRAVTDIHKHGDDGILADAMTHPQRFRADSLEGHDRVSAKFLGGHKEDTPPYRFPRLLQDDKDDGPEDEINPYFAFGNHDDRRRLALIHADLSRLGEIFRGAMSNKEDPAEILGLATGIQSAILAAATTALRDVILPKAVSRGKNFQDRVLPARPIVLGGDDITLLVRADLALPFTRALLQGIEHETVRIRDRTGVENLSACAGIAIFNAKQPFLMAHALAEDLCSHAKKVAKRAGGQAPYPSMFSFHVIQSTLDEGYETIRKREREHADRKSGTRHVLTVNPVAVGGDGLTYGHLERLACALEMEAKGRGKLIELRNLLLEDGWSVDAGEKWKRYREVLEKRNPEAMAKIDEELKACGATDPEREPWTGRNGVAIHPLFDALELLDLKGTAG